MVASVETERRSKVIRAECSLPRQQLRWVGGIQGKVKLGKGTGLGVLGIGETVLDACKCTSYTRTI